MASYDFREVEKRWMEKFEGFDGYKGKDFGEKEKRYVLVEFPYPSGEGLHVGHAFSMTGSDVYARYLRMKGFNVIFPMGWDAFGLPAENYAIKTGIQPQVTTDRITKLIKGQMKRMAFSFDWEREINTTLPEYYKWTQWIFIKLFEKGLAYKKEMPINWCPSCKIGLANEEVIDGKCERCGTATSKRNISQWVVKITAYADRLLDGLKDTDFIEKVKAAQVNWIDRKEGRLIRFQINGWSEIATSQAPRNDGGDGSETPLGFAASPLDKGDQIEVFTTRADTLGGVEFLVLAPDHEVIGKFTDDRSQITDYVEEFRKRDVKDRSERKKTGVLLSIKAVNPLNDKEMPVYVADYVSSDFGTGAIMGVPSHDERDREFAKAMGIEFDQNFVPSENNIGEKKVTYHLRDWIFSRQHYWGEPIPMIWCENCAKSEIATAQSTEIRNDANSNDGMGAGWVAVPEKDLPVVLPPVEKYQPTDTGESPLANISDWVKTTCPKCGGEAKRETDTMPNWAGSDWYFLRYIDNKNKEVLADMEKMKYWLPVDVYIGGDEHNTLHLLYSRFIYQFLFDLEVVPKEHPEPYKKRLSHGVILGSDGNRMSKSKGNVIVPDEFVEKYGADSLRIYLMFMGPFDATMAWNERSLIGVKRFVEKFSNYVISQISPPEADQPMAEDDRSQTRLPDGQVSDNRVKILINKLVKVAGEDLENFKFNTVVARLMETTNSLSKLTDKIQNEDLRTLVKVIAPFAPFVSQELWTVLAEEGSVHSQSFPKVEEKYLLNEMMTLAVQVNGKVRGIIQIEPEANEEAVIERAKKEEKIAKYLAGGEIKKVIYIKGKALNFVVG